MRLSQLVATSAAVAATSSRREKVALIADLLRELGPDETVPAVAYLSGELRQRQIGVGWASVADVPSPTAEPVLTVSDVDSALARIGEQRGAGSAARRRQLLAELFGAATAEEQQFLRALVTGELRQGALAGVMADAVAKAGDVPVAAVRRALLLSGDLREVAAAALGGGAAALAEFRLQVGRPLAPMLAQAAPNIDDAMAKVCPAVVDYKLDGVRIQAHRDGDEIAVFTRSLDDITSRLPEVVAAVRELPVRTAVLDGEVIALRPDGRPQPFQITASRVGQRGKAGAAAPAVTLRPYFFDVLHLDGEDLLDTPGRDRWAALESVVPAVARVPRRSVASVAEAAAVFAAAIDAGHEGVVVKSPEARYDAGRRGGGWLKVKPRHTLDLVILAAEWGHGRRRGWLSNLHLGARDDTGTGHVMLGKTFKGLTDELLRWQTRRLLELETHRDSWTVYVRPELVVEVAFDGVQASSRYPGGLALRFARVLRFRDDKPAAEADTVATVRAIHSGHLGGQPT